LSTRLAVKQADDSEGLDGDPFVLVQCSYEESASLDDFDSDEAGAAMGAYLADDLGAYAIVGPATSGVTEATWTTVGPLGPLFVSPSATSPALSYADTALTPEGHAGRLWRTAPPDSAQGEVMAQIVAEFVYTGSNKQKVALAYQEGPYGEGLAEVFIDNYSTDNHTADRKPFHDDTSRDNAVNAIANGGYDAVIFISSDLPDVSAFLNGAAARDEFEYMPIFLADAAKDAELLVQTTSASDIWINVWGTAPAVPSGDVYDAFAVSYASEYDGKDAADSSYSAYAYDAAWLAIYGSAWSRATLGAVTGQGAADGLREISESGVPASERVEIEPTSWIEVRAAFSGGNAIDVVGASGQLDYDPETEETTGPIEVWWISSDGFETYDTIEP
jgi:branched-chain amino acid transport system substrate-binding protein